MVTWVQGRAIQEPSFSFFLVGQFYFILFLAAGFLFTCPMFVNVCFPPRCLLSSLLTGHQGAQMAEISLEWESSSCYPLGFILPFSVSAG